MLMIFYYYTCKETHIYFFKYMFLLDIRKYVCHGGATEQHVPFLIVHNILADVFTSNVFFFVENLRTCLFLIQLTHFINYILIFQVPTLTAIEGSQTSAQRLS